MGLQVAGVLLLCCASYGYQFSGISSYGLSVPELEWSEASKVKGEEDRIAVPPRDNTWKSGSTSVRVMAKKVPIYRSVSASEDQKELFKPERGIRPLPDSVKRMLLLTAAPSTTESTLSRPVDVLCHLDRIYVRVRKDIFGDVMAYKGLKLGLCPVNQGTSEHFYFLYHLDSKCGFKWESEMDYVSVSTVLSYMPYSSSHILRAIPFNVPLQCRYHRKFHSYGVGFYPTLAMGTVFKSLTSAADVVLIAQDASGIRLSGSVSYILGQPMYFEAKLSDPTTNKRVYINKCFATTSPNLNTMPKYTVIDNRGCMIDGKVTQQSRFLPQPSKTSQRFSVGAFIFAEAASTLKLYMHCEITVGPPTPTRSTKACNYDFATRTWQELYGERSLCTCCESSCSSASPHDFKTMVSSPSWQVDSKQVYVEPDFKSLMPETFDTEDHSDFLNYWDHDY